MIKHFFFNVIYFSFVLNFYSCGDPEYDQGHVKTNQEMKEEMLESLSRLSKLAINVKEVIQRREDDEQKKGDAAIYMNNKVKKDIFDLMDEIIKLSTIDDSKKLDINFTESIEKVSSMKVNSVYTVYTTNEKGHKEDTKKVEEELSKNLQKSYDDLYIYMDKYRKNYQEIKN